MSIPKYIGKIRQWFVGDINAQLAGYINARLEQVECLLKLSCQMNAQVDFRSQINQDLYAYLYFRGKPDGFYIDIGANDGETFSNTYTFEKLGWSGVCVEPLPDVFNQLKQCRKCDCYNVAIADTSQTEIEFIKATGLEMLSGLKEQMTDEHQNRILNERGKIETIKVNTLTFDDLMKNYPERHYVDFLSIDVEGAEMSILKNIDFQKYNFGLITVENNDEQKEQKLKELMDRNGYKVFAKLAFDIMFIPK